LKKLVQTRWFEIILLALISGFTYLPRIGELTYYRDDWYFLYDALVIGPGALIEIALHTRPIRGPLYALYFSLFGLNPFPYHVVMYLTRLLGGLGALWLFNLIWSQNRRVNFYMTTLFLLFPGFLWWVAGFEFQPYVLSVGLQTFSIAFTLKAIASDSIPRRLGWTIAGLLSGWAYLALVEYAIGMEAFRLICVYLSIRQKTRSTLIGSVLPTLKASAPHLLIPIGFLIWYQFLFDNWRQAQDAGTQFGILFSSTTTMIWRLVEVARSFLNVSLFAWVIPFYQNFYGNRLRDIATGLVFAALVIALVYLANKFLNRFVNEPNVEDEPDTYSRRGELIWVGLLGTLGGVLPIVFANRVVTFERISQYTLPASLTGVIFLSGLIFSVFPQKFRMLLLSGLAGLAVLAHHGLAAQAVTEERIISDFWQQVVWRAPDIMRGATLVVTYPGVGYSDGNDVAWGPANFIYYPDGQEQMPVHIPLPASRLEQDSILHIINGNKSFEQTDLVIKNIYMEMNYKNQLILTQPLQTSCVHALDPRWPDISIYDQLFIHASYQNSRVENIIMDTEFHALPAYAFGLELPHEWCYYYQKADLARQQGKWDEIVSLDEEVQKLGLHPNDQIEWMPFLQAYAFVGNEKQVKKISTRINTESFYQQLACRNLNAMVEHGYPLEPEMQSYVDELFCQ